MTQPRRRKDGTYDMPISTAHVGAELLEIISGALYGNHLDIIREYIQNAVDGRAADVTIELSGDDLVITDNGRGMDLQELDEARKVAVSRKRRDAQVGFRGIGIYSSFSVCDRLELITRAAASNQSYELQFDYREMRRAIERARNGETDPLSLIDLLSDHTLIQDAAEARTVGLGESFTQARLSGISPALRAAVEDRASLQAYLVSTVPLDFPDEFEHAEVLRDAIRSQVPNTNLIRIHLKWPDGGETTLRRPNLKHPLPPTTRILRDPDTHEPVALLWACLNRERKAIQPAEMQGFVIRVKGFAIGDARLLSRLWGAAGHGVLYPWYAGEIYVLDPSVIPNAPRNDFDPSPAKDRLYELAKKAFSELEHAANTRRDALVEMQRVAEGKRERSEVPKLLNRLDSARKELRAVGVDAVEDFLDEKGRRFLGVTSVSRQPTSPSTSPATKTPKRVGVEEERHVEIGEDDKLVQILFQVNFNWPEEAKDVFEIVDETLLEAVTRPQYLRCSHDVREKLKTLEYLDELDEGD